MKRKDLKKGMRVFVSLGNEGYMGKDLVRNSFIEVTLVDFTTTRTNPYLSPQTSMEFDNGYKTGFTGNLRAICPVNEHTKKCTEIIHTALKEINKIREEQKCININDWFLLGFLTKEWIKLCHARSEKRFDEIHKKLNVLINKLEKLAKKLDPLNIEGNSPFYQ